MKMAQEIEVDGKKYVVNPFLTSNGMMLLTDLIKLVGEPLITLISKLGLKEGKNLLEQELNAEDLQGFMAVFTKNLDGDTIDKLFKRILKNTLIGSTSQSCAQVYDTHFSGDYFHLFKVVFASLKVQYGGFSGGLSGLAAYAKAVSHK